MFMCVGLWRPCERKVTEMRVVVGIGYDLTSRWVPRMTVLQLPAHGVIFYLVEEWDSLSRRVQILITYYCDAITATTSTMKLLKTMQCDLEVLEVKLKSTMPYLEDTWRRCDSPLRLSWAFNKFRPDTTRYCQIQPTVHCDYPVSTGRGSKMFSICCLDRHQMQNFVYYVCNQNIVLCK